MSHPSSAEHIIVTPALTPCLALDQSTGALSGRVMKDRFFQFSWRPRNLSLLSEDAQRDIAKNLKKYSEKFARDDDMILQQVCLPPESPNAIQHHVICVVTIRI